MACFRSWGRGITRPTWVTKAPSQPVCLLHLSRGQGQEMSKGRSISVPCGPSPIPPVRDCQRLQFLSKRQDLQKCHRVASGTWPSLSKGLGYWLQVAPLLGLNQAVGSFLDFWPNSHSIFQPHWNQSKHKASLAFSLNCLSQFTQAQKKPGDVNECLIWLWLIHPVRQP